MSLLRYRAMDVSAESIRSARRPAFARDLFVSDTSSCSDAELNVPPAQANAGDGVTRSPIEVTANAAAVRIVSRARLLSARGRATSPDVVATGRTPAAGDRNKAACVDIGLPRGAAPAGGPVRLPR